MGLFLDQSSFAINWDKLLKAINILSIQNGYSFWYCVFPSNMKVTKQPDFFLNEAFQRTHSKCDNMAFVQTDRINVY